MTKTPATPQYRGVSRPGPPGSGLAEFNEVYDRELDYVWRIARRLGVPESDVPDAVHEVFLVLYRRWNELDRKDTLRAWLFGVTRRVAAGLRAKHHEQPTELDPAAVEDPLAAKRQLLRNAMATLDDDRRTVIVLHDLEGHTGAEIAAMLDIPVNTVHSRLRLARADLVVAVKKAGTR